MRRYSGVVRNLVAVAMYVNQTHTLQLSQLSWMENLRFSKIKLHANLCRNFQVKMSQRLMSIGADASEEVLQLRRDYLNIYQF